MKIISLCPEYFPGVCSVFENMRDLKLCEFIKLGGKEVQIPLSEFYLLGAWLPEYENLIKELKKAQAKIGIVWTSTTAQMEQTPNGIELKYLEKILEMLKNNEIDYLFFGDKNLFQYYEGRKGIHPFFYPISIKLIEQYKANKTIDNTIGLFVPNSPRKNIMGQIYAFLLSARKNTNLMLYTNTGVDAFEKNITSYGWLKEEEYHDLLGKMKIILHCTHTESFGYAVVEAIMMGVLPIMSPCIKDNLNLPEEICVNNPDSPIKISEKINEIMAWPKEHFDETLSKCQLIIKELAQNNNFKLKEMLGKLGDVV